MKKFIPFVVFLFINISANAAPSKSAFIEGNILFAQENYADAKDAYLNALRQSESSNLHYNLANTYWKLSKPQYAIYHYLKSLLLDPTNNDARNNLHFIASLNDVTLTETPDESLVFIFNETQWTWVIAVSAWIILCLFLWKKIKPNTSIPLKTSSLFCFLLILFSVYSLIQFDRYKSISINVNQDLMLKVAPTEQSPAQAEIVNWTLFKVIDTQNSYFYIRLEDGTHGYVLKNEVLHLGS